MEIFCNEEELNDSNIDAFTNQWLAFIAGYYVVKIEWKLNVTLIALHSEKHCMILVKTLKITIQQIFQI